MELEPPTEPARQRPRPVEESAKAGEVTGDFIGDDQPEMVMIALNQATFWLFVTKIAGSSAKWE